MKLPQVKRILREDLKGAPDWVTFLIEPINSFIETVYLSLNKNITFQENILSNIKDITFRTTSAYPTMEPISFRSNLKSRAIGLIVISAYEKDTYVPAAGPVYAAWTEVNGSIEIQTIAGLAQSKVYEIRFLVF